MMQFQKATKKQSRLRLALIGPSGSGKTYTALILATALGNKVALIDTERGSASKYSDLFGFDVLELERFSPATYIEAIHAAEQAGYEVLVIDSLSHAWIGREGVLEIVDRETMRSQSKNAFSEGWRKASPEHNKMVDAIIQSSVHVIATMRAKTEYIVEVNDKGKSVPRKVGLAPIQRDGLEYEFDVVADMDLDNNLIISKTRCSALTGALIPKPTAELAGTLKAWLTDGVAVTAAPQPGTQAKAVPPAPNGSGDKFPLETIAAVIKAKMAPDANYANDALKGCIVPKDADPEIVGRWLKAYQGYIDQGETAAKATGAANKGYASWLAKQAEQPPA